MIRSDADLVAPSSKQLDIALLILRVIVGIVFIAHGGQKFVFGHTAVSGMFSQMGIPAAPLSAAVVMAVELMGGIALVLGLFTRIAAVLVACDMLGAILLVHIKGGFFLPNGAEYPLTLLAALVALALTGAGAYSVDNAMARRRVRSAE